jgi:hypothetical protein
MAFDLLTKAARLLVGRRYTSTDLSDSQEAFTSTIQMGADEIWSQTSLIPSSSLPFSSSATAGSTQTSGVVKYWFKFPMTVANDTSPANSVWFFMSPTGSASGTGSQLIVNGQQTNFISPKYSVTTIANQTADASNNGNPPGYNIALFTSANGVTFTNWTASNYAFDYKTGVLQFSGSNVPSNRIYATVYQYIGQFVSEALVSGSTNSVSSSYFSGSVITASNLTVVQTSSLNIVTANTASAVYFSLTNSGSAPANSTDSGLPGEMRFDDNYVYIYTNNVWTRIPKARWT